MSPLSPILFAGSAMITGHPVEADISLARTALRSLGRRASEMPCVLPHIHLRSASRLVEACRAHETEFLVLQLGHHETTRSFRNLLFNKDEAKPTSGKPPFPPAPKRLFRPSLHHRLEMAGRFVAAQALTVSGQQKRVFDLAAAADALDCLLSRLAPLSLRGILLLSPFSCPDLTTRAYRRQLLPVFVAAAKKHGCLYVDVFGMLENCRRHDEYLANFADSFNLSRQGHLRVGMLIGQYLRRVVREVNPGYLPAMDVWPPLPSLQLPADATAKAR